MPLKQQLFYLSHPIQYSVIEYWYKDYTSKPFVFLLRYYYVHFESMFRLVNHVSGNVCARVTWSKSPICISQIRLPLARARGLEAETVTLS